MKILKVHQLEIPKILPHPNAIKSFGDNHHGYDPEVWEFQYEIYRYLEHVSDNELDVRYVNLVRNMKALVSPERHVIPIWSFLSSWYWFRKEHQTRLEFNIRGRDIPVVPPSGVLDNTPIGNPIRPRHPNSGDVLFRYGLHQYMYDMVRKGSIRISPANFYKRLEKDFTRHDDELQKQSFMSGRYTRILTQKGLEIPIIGNVQKTISVPNYFVLCMSCDWDIALFKDFDADSCVIIHYPEIFAERLENALRAKLNDWHFYHFPVQYFDPYEKIKDEYISVGASKDFRFAYQREYRFLWMHPDGIEASDFIYVEIGALDDIASLHQKPLTA